MAFIPSKPGHSKFIFRNMNATDYKKLSHQYSRAKAGGIRCTYAWMSGAGALGIAKDVGKGIVINYGKRKLAAVVINAGTYMLSPAVIVFTNATKIVDTAKRLHSVSAFCFECAEDSTNVAFLPLDLMLFGQPIPVGAENRFDLFGNHTDFLDL